MSTAAPIAPTKAAGVMSALCSGKSSRTRMPMSPAPDEMPMMCGSASGFFMMACRMAPESARSMPTSAATSVRGSRIFQRICVCVLPSAPMRMAAASCGAMATEPIIRLTRTPEAASTRKIRKTAASRPLDAPRIIQTPPGRGTSPSTPRPPGNGCPGSAGRGPVAGSRRGPRGRQRSSARQDCPA